MTRRNFTTAVAAGFAGSAWLSADEPLRLAIGGLHHGHASGFLTRLQKRNDVRLVGVAEDDSAVAGRYAAKYGLARSVMFAGMDDMLTKSKPDAVALFTSTAGHRAGVEACARHKTPVMMEKPLAVSVEEGRAIASAAASAGIPVIVNYETTWYRSNRQAFEDREDIGGVRKVVVHDGHQGPKEIGVQPEFFAWLTDPAQGGAGALFDFGCYGADLITWLMDGQRPITVTAVTQQMKPTIYPKVDDEATVIVTYPHALGIIQASWNWPFDRKDMEVYGQTGYVLTVGHDEVKRRLRDGKEELIECPALAAPEDDPISYLAAVARGKLKPSGLSSLETNLIVTEILDTARRSAKTGETIRLPV